MSTSGFPPGTGDLGDHLGVRRQQRPEPAIAGRLGNEAERRAPEQDGVATALVVIGRHGDRAGRVGLPVEQRLDHRGGDERLVAEGDEHGLGGRRHRLEPDLQRARQATARVRVDDALFVAPFDRAFDRGGVVTEDDHDLPHPGLGHRVEHVLEHRPAADGRQQLPATEPRRRTCGEDQADRRLVHARIFPPWAGPSHRARRPAARPFAGRPSRTPDQAIASARSRIGAPEPP